LIMKKKIRRCKRRQLSDNLFGDIFD